MNLINTLVDFNSLFEIQASKEQICDVRVAYRTLKDIVHTDVLFMFININ